MKRRLSFRLVGDESGAVLVEYALVLSLLSVAFIGGLELIEAATDGAMFTVENGFTAYELRTGSGS